MPRASVSGSGYWNYVDIYGFYEPIQNVSKVRILFYSAGDTTSGSPIPSESYKYLYFCSRHTHDDTSSSISWSITQSLQIPSPVQKTPHLLEWTFSSPVTVAQWMILPQSPGSGYIRSPGDIEYVNFITNDGKSFNYKL